MKEKFTNNGKTIKKEYTQQEIDIIRKNASFLDVKIPFKPVFSIDCNSKAQDVFRAIVQLMSYSEVTELIRLLNLSQGGCQDILDIIDEKDRNVYDLDGNDIKC